MIVAYGSQPVIGTSKVRHNCCAWPNIGCYYWQQCGGISFRHWHQKPRFCGRLIASKYPLLSYCAANIVLLTRKKTLRHTPHHQVFGGCLTKCSMHTSLKNIRQSAIVWLDSIRHSLLTHSYVAEFLTHKNRISYFFLRDVRLRKKNFRFESIAIFYTCNCDTPKMNPSGIGCV